MPNVEFILDIGGQAHQVSEDSRRTHRQHLPQRGLLLRVRFLLQTFASALGYSIEEFSNSGCSPTAGGSRFPLHGIHETLGQTGAEGRRHHREHFGGPVDQYCEKTHSIK